MIGATGVSPVGMGVRARRPGTACTGEDARSSTSGDVVGNVNGYGL